VTKRPGSRTVASRWRSSSSSPPKPAGVRPTHPRLVVGHYLQILAEAVDEQLIGSTLPEVADQLQGHPERLHATTDEVDAFAGSRHTADSVQRPRCAPAGALWGLIVAGTAWRIPTTSPIAGHPLSHGTRRRGWRASAACGDVGNSSYKPRSAFLLAVSPRGPASRGGQGASSQVFAPRRLRRADREGTVEGRRCATSLPEGHLKLPPEPRNLVIVAHAPVITPHSSVRQHRLTTPTGRRKTLACRLKSQEHDLDLTSQVRRRTTGRHRHERIGIVLVQFARTA
jgi:hypothetical protein